MIASASRSEPDSGGPADRGELDRHQSMSAPESAARDPRRHGRRAGARGPHGFERAIGALGNARRGECDAGCHFVLALGDRDDAHRGLRGRNLDQHRDQGEGRGLGVVRQRGISIVDANPGGSVLELERFCVEAHAVSIAVRLRRVRCGGGKGGRKEESRHRGHGGCHRPSHPWGRRHSNGSGCFHWSPHHR